MASAAFTPDDMIALTGCGTADSIEHCLLEACDREMNRPDGEPRDIELAFNCVRAVILRLNGNDAPDVQQYMAAAILRRARSEEHTSELQSLMRISYAVFCLKKKKQ